MGKSSRFLVGVLLITGAGLFPTRMFGQTPRPAWQAEWQKTIEGGRKEGKVVASIPPSPELRKAIDEAFTKRFGIVIESVPARGATIIRRIVDETKAGTHYFDLHFGGTESIVKGLLPEGVLDAVEPWLVLPEVKDPKNWWGGHIWIDNAKRYVYPFSAYQTANVWYNSTLVKAEEVKSFDDLLDPKWKGRIGFSDPRTPGSGASMWSYIVQVKGEDYAKRLVGQKLFITRDLRLLAENLARGQVSIALGIGYSESLPFVRAGLPVKALSTPKEGVYATGGYGNLTVIKNPPHPNATKVFVNWLLGNEGQEIFDRSMRVGSRRLDVDTRWLKEIGAVAAKDGLTLDQYYKMENQSETQIYKVRDPGAALANKLLD